MAAISFSAIIQDRDDEGEVPAKARNFQRPIDFLSAKHQICFM
jgi:hypothetical protein